jgi:hypothetical protein
MFNKLTNMGGTTLFNHQTTSKEKLQMTHHHVQVLVQNSHFEA